MDKCDVHSSELCEKVETISSCDKMNPINAKSEGSSENQNSDPCSKMSSFTVKTESQNDDPRCKIDTMHVKSEGSSENQNSCDKVDIFLVKSNEGCSESQNHDPYFYTKRNDFTSEIFKIEIGNLPNYVGYGQLRKFLKSRLKLDTHKIKAIGSPPQFAFITFKNEEDRNKALVLLDGYLWKGKTLFAKKANPMADPLVKKRQAGDSEDSPSAKKSRMDENLSASIRLRNAVTPLWNIPYSKQLHMKENDVHHFLIKLGRQIEHVNKSFETVLGKNRIENQFQCCPMDPVKPSPSTTGYRNKCEFTVGKLLDTDEKVVGFRLSSYKEGSMSVAKPDDCVNISQSMIKAAKSFEAYVRSSDKDVFNPETHEGYWKQLTVRISRNSDVMIIVVMHPQNLTENDLTEEKLQLKEYFETGCGTSCGITSVYFQISAKKQANQGINLVHLSGKKHIEENVLGMTFRISPEAFFQVNTQAAEVLYSTIADVVGENPSSSVFDICCGTGTISLCIAKQAGKVIGIESCSQAVEDANCNAKLNNITNVEFICGKAEDVIFAAINGVGNSEISAIVDPPRAGLHPRVLKIIRSNTNIKRLVYVSCNFNAAMTNFVDLCRPSSNNYRGDPFYPVKAIPIDLFPHTPYCELVLIFERIDVSTSIKE